MTAKEELTQLRTLGAEMVEQAETAAALWARATSVTQHISDMPGGGPRQDMADMVAAMVDMDRETAERVAAYSRLERDILARICQIEDGRYRRLLVLRYMEGLSWEDVAEAMSYSRVQTFRLHGQALVEYDRLRQDDTV